jgi:hypothetical protein
MKEENMNSNDEKRSIVWSACGCDDPKTYQEYEQFDSQDEAEEFARQRGLPFVVGHTLITFNDDEDDWEFDEDVEPVFVRVRGVRLWTAAMLAKRHDTRLKCRACSFKKIFRNRRDALTARDVHQFEHGVDELRKSRHPVFVQRAVNYEGKMGDSDRRWIDRVSPS